ncbi:MAG: carbohydrate ABC transporter permease, partial [Firmicutes bacterium]|nr:carbohydrate ABC transporter permease [Bacillota bacterium]
LTLSSLKGDKEIIQYPPSLLPSQITARQYIKVWESIPLLSFLKNTAVFSGGVTLISILFDSMAGYAFARLNFKGKKPLFIFVLITMMVPYQVIMIPLFIEIFKLGLLDTYIGLILPRATSAFGIYLMRSFFISLPAELEESARIDGLNEFKIYSSIMLPLCKPALITLAIFHFMNNWNDLLYPLMLTNSTRMRTLSAGLAMFVGDRVIEYGPTFAATLISILPLLLAYVFAQKYFIRGVATTGLKN